MPYLPSAPVSSFVSNATTSTKETVPGTSFPTGVNRKTKFKYNGMFTVVATTTGVGFGIDVPSGCALLAQVRVTISTTAGTDATYEALLTTDDTFTIPTDVAATAGSLFSVEGYVISSTTDGVASLRVDTDAAAAVTIPMNVIETYYGDMGSVV